MVILIFFRMDTRYTITICLLGKGTCILAVQFCLKRYALCKINYFNTVKSRHCFKKSNTQSDEYVALFDHPNP